MQRANNDARLSKRGFSQIFMDLALGSVSVLAQLSNHFSSKTLNYLREEILTGSFVSAIDGSFAS